MSNNNRELSQIAAFLEVIEPSKNIYIKTLQGENIGIGTTVPIAKVDIIGNVRVSGILTAQSIVSSNSNTLQNVNVLGISTSVNLNITGVTTTARLAVSGITTTQNLTVVGVSTFQNNAYFGDNDSLYFGDGSDLQIYHSGSNTFISNTVGDLYLTDNGGAIRLQPVSGESSAIFNGNGSVELYHDNVKKFETTAGGAIVTGILTATTLVGTVAYASSTGFSTTSSYATVAGLSTLATTATTATYAVTAGFATGTTYSTTSGVATAVNGTANVTLLQSAGISTFTNGPVLIGAGTSTQTAAQGLQVTGGAYVSGNLGIGATNPTENLHIVKSSGDFIRLENSTSNGRTSILYDPVGNNWEVGARSSAATQHPNSYYIFDVAAGEYRQVIDSSGNILIGSGVATSTGTLNQKLQVTGGAYVSGNLGVGATNPVARIHAPVGPILVGSATSSGVAAHNLQVYGGAYFSNTSNIGFGTTAPRANVDFQGTVYFNNAVAVGTTSVLGAVSINGGISLSGGYSALNVSSGINTIPTTINSSLSGGTLQIFSGGLLSTSSRGGQIDFVGGASTIYPGELLFRTGIGTLGTSQPITARLDTSGVLYANTFTSTSDERLKTNIERIDDPFVILNEVKGVRFNWKDGGDPSVGVIAQDVEKVLPEAVKTDPEGMKSVCYDMLIGVLIEAIKDQQKRIDDLEARLKCQ
jgi:hypothetical protein